MDISGGQQGGSGAEKPIPKRDLGASSKQLVPSDSGRLQDIPRYKGGQQRGSTERFMERFEIDNPDACWEWKGSRTRRGYGQFWMCGTNHGAHRVMWELLNGPVPDGLHVLHRCDNPPCVNPNHLWIGTREDNMRDMVSKGRAKNGATKPDPWHSPDWDDVWWWCDARIGEEFPDLRGVA